MRTRIPVVLVLAGLAVACATATPGPTPQPTATPVPTATATAIPPTATPAPLRVWLGPAVPLAVRDLAVVALSDRSTVLARSQAEADLHVDVGLGVELARWVYAVVVPFPTVADDLSWGDVLGFWAGESTALTYVSGDKTSPTLFVDPETVGVLYGWLGLPSAKAPITVVDSTQLLDQAWSARPHAWAIVPFEALEPRWKVLAVDGANVLDKRLDVTIYPLAVPIGAEGEGAEELAAALLKDDVLLTNRDVHQMTTLMMTGVTALVRGIAAKMEEKGLLYPAEKVGQVLREADLLHISNEISFTDECPPPNPRTDSLAFCSSPDYVELLRAIGTDVIELTGNHVKDYGSRPMLYTLEIYRQENWPYFGGGKDLKEALEPLVIEKNGVTFGFIGCNPVGPEYAWATADRPGAAPCDYDDLHARLEQLKSQVDIPVATLQYWEFYQYEPTEQQRRDFRGLVDAGAAIVSGSQAHHPQAIEFYKGGFIHYGLGNLFFDQMWSLGTRQEFVDRHVFYQGRHISTELLTFMLEDYSQPRPMTVEERQALLKSVFKASGW